MITETDREYLAGEATTRSRIKVQSYHTSEVLSSTNFAMAIGGGLDVQINDRVDLRVFQFDYNPIFIHDPSPLGFDTRADNVRYSFGVLFK